MEKLDAIILDQFSKGPGSDKVKSGEYLLHDGRDSSQAIRPSDFGTFVPGMRITMALMVGQYGERTFKKCPRVGCLSSRIQKLPNGGMAW
jgi:hypothetical protein